MLIVGDAGVKVRPVADRFAAEADQELSGSMPGVATKVAGFFAAAFAAVKIGGFLKDAVGEATDLGESVSKAQVVFGDASAGIMAFADTASTALGQSRNQAIAAAGTFGTLFTGMGIGQDKAAGLSTDLVTLASDMASFGNATPQEALDALRSGLVGETEPLRRFGVMLSAAAIEAEATKLGLEQVNGEFTAGAKAQATYSLIMAQAGVQHGDFQRTSAGLANQQRILAAQFTDLQANVGGLFVPALAGAAHSITNGLMPGILSLTAGLPALGTAIGDIGNFWAAGFNDGPELVNEATAGLEGLPFVIGQVAGTAGDLGAIFREALVDGAAGSALLAEDSLQGMAARAGVNFSFLRGVIASTWETLQSSLTPVIGPVLGTLQSAFGTIGETISGAFGGGASGGLAFNFLNGLQGVVATVLPLVIDYFTRWAGVIQAVIPIIVTVIQGLVPVIVDLVGQIGPVLQSLLPVVSQVAGVFATTLLTVIQALAPVIPPLVAAIGQVASALAGAFLQVLQAIAPVLPVIARVIGQVAEMLAGALASALQAVIPILPPLVTAFAQIAVVLVGALMGALQAILPIIPTLVGALLALIQAAVLPLLPLLPTLASLFMSIISALAPLIPPLLQLVAIVIQLVVAAIVPLLPLIPTLVGLFTLLLNILLPVVQVVIGVVAAFVQMASIVLTVVFGFVSAVIGAFTSFWSGITSLVSRIAGGVIGGFTGLKNGIVDLFSGIADTVGGFFEGIGGAIKGAINGVIRGINNTVIGGLNLVIDGVNVVNPFTDIPHVPRIPTFHTGGTFRSGSAAGEGLAWLRDNETVVTPEDRDRAAALLVAATAGNPPTSTTGAGGLAAANIKVVGVENMTVPEQATAGEIAAQTSQSVAWKLRTGVTNLPGLAVGVP